MKRSKRITLDDLPPKYREQAEAQLKVWKTPWDNPPLEYIEKTKEYFVKEMEAHPGDIDVKKIAAAADRAVRLLATGKDSLPVRKDSKPKRPHRQPNKTEARFNMEMLGNKGEYEAVSFRTPAGRYTPDFCVWDDEGRLTCYEVKGGYRMNSQQAARRAFLDTADRFKHVTFKWYKKTKSGWEEWYGQTD